MSAPTIRCRPIAPSDIDRIIAFRARESVWRRASWAHVFRRLSEHATPAGFPKYGYLLESDGVPVGVLLLIYSAVPGPAGQIRCSVSNWYVEPAFRGYAAMLVSHALTHRGVTYTNVTPTPHTWPILEAQGYARYCQGIMVSVPALSLRSARCRVEMVTPDMAPDDGLASSERDLLLAHTNYDCFSLVCRTGDGSYPFIFTPRRKTAMLPFVHLAYCRDRADFIRFARPLGRFLMRRGIALVLVDSDGPIPGIAGKYVGNRPKYFKGPDRPRLGDLVYSEIAMFGL